MAKDVIMPVLGMNQDTAVLVSWLAREGDTVVEGEPLMEVETDKAVMQLDAPASGTLVDVTAADGDDVPVGSVIARILADGEAHAATSGARSVPSPDTGTPARAGASSAATGTGPAAPPPAAPSAASASPDAVSQDVAAGAGPSAGAASEAGPRPPASPLARRTARERGLDLAELAGSGPYGAVLMRDVPEAGSAQVAEAAPRTEPAPAASPAVEAVVAYGELERRLDAGPLIALLNRSGAGSDGAARIGALARFLAAAVRHARSPEAGAEPGVTVQVRGPDGRRTLAHADRRSILDLAARVATDADDADATPGADTAQERGASGAPDAALTHAGDEPLDALRPSGGAPLALGVAWPAPPSGDALARADTVPLVLTLRYDAARVDDAAALAVLRAMARLVADPTALAVAY